MSDVTLGPWYTTQGMSSLTQVADYIRMLQGQINHMIVDRRDQEVLHARQVADLKQRIRDLENLLQIDTIHADLRQRISELEAQKPVIYVLKEEKP